MSKETGRVNTNQLGMRLILPRIFVMITLICSCLKIGRAIKMLGSVFGGGNVPADFEVCHPAPLNLAGARAGISTTARASNSAARRIFSSAQGNGGLQLDLIFTSARSRLK